MLLLLLETVLPTGSEDPLLTSFPPLVMTRVLPEPELPMVNRPLLVQTEPVPVITALLKFAVDALPMVPVVSIRTPLLVMERKLLVPVLPRMNTPLALDVTPLIVVTVLSSAQAGMLAQTARTKSITIVGRAV